MERIATGGSVALMFQLSFKQSLPGLSSESIAHPDRRKTPPSISSGTHCLAVLRYLCSVLTHGVYFTASSKGNFVGEKLCLAHFSVRYTKTTYTSIASTII